MRIQICGLVIVGLASFAALASKPPSVPIKPNISKEICNKLEERTKPFADNTKFGPGCLEIVSNNTKRADLIGAVIAWEVSCIMEKTTATGPYQDNMKSCHNEMLRNIGFVDGYLAASPSTGQ